MEPSLECGQTTRVVSIGSPVDGFLRCQCNKSNQTELINSHLISKAMQSRAPLGDAQEGRGREDESKIGRFMGQVLNSG